MILFYNKIFKKLINVGVEMGVATRMAQVVWPMMTVTATNFEGFTIGSNSNICKNVDFGKIRNTHDC